MLYNKYSLVICFIHGNVYMSIADLPTHPTQPFPSWFPYACSVCLCLYFCFANKFICTILLIHIRVIFSSVQFSSVAQSCPTLCDRMNRSTPGLPVHHQLPEFTQTHVHRVSDAIQPSHPLPSPSPPAPNPSQHQSLFQSVNSSHVLEFQL